MSEKREQSDRTEHLRLDHTVTFLALRKRIDTADLSTCPWRSFEPFCVWIKFQNANNHSVLYFFSCLCGYRSGGVSHVQKARDGNGGHCEAVQQIQRPE